MADQSWEVNCAPLSEEMSAGRPKREIQLAMRARVQDTEEVSLSGIASGHLVKRSTMVSRCVLPCDEGNGPTMSMFEWWKRRGGTWRV